MPPKLDKVPLTTQEVAALFVLERNIDSRWVTWALEMLERGHDTPHLRILAGEIAPFNYFEMRNLMAALLSELGIGTDSSTEQAARTLASVSIQKTLAGSTSYTATLSEISQLYIEQNYLSCLQDFYLLQQAKEDFKTQDITYHWPEATEENIDKIVEDTFRKWAQT